MDGTKIFGLQIQLTTTAKNDEEGRALLKELGMPFTPDRPKKGASAASPDAVGRVESKAKASDTPTPEPEPKP